MEVKQKPGVYPFTRKGEIFLRYGSLGNIIYKVESFFRKNPDKPKYIFKRKQSRIYCNDCKHELKNPRLMVEPCKKHPYYFRNKNNDCKSFIRKWWKIWMFDKCTGFGLTTPLPWPQTVCEWQNKIFSIKLDRALNKYWIFRR